MIVQHKFTVNVVLNRIIERCLRIIEIDPVVLGTNRDGVAYRIDLIVAVNLDGALCHVGTERLAVYGFGLVQDFVRALLQVVHGVGEVLYKVIVESQLQSTIRSNCSLTISVGMSAVQDIACVHFGGRSRRISGLPLQVLCVG